ncbi:MAG TPA: M20 family metallopeptidase [Rectinemataceae bacterium]|nr:M20 family metallopeptidase [Rectinemataceae bacterium]
MSDLPAGGRSAAAILERAHALAPRLVELRRAVHARPEIGFHESATAALVEAALRELGARVLTGVGGTGVVGEFGPESGLAIVLRADMDALPLREESGAPYASLVEGMMHACGHDAHVACLLGAAMLAAEDTAAEDTAAGPGGGAPRKGAPRLRFLFQPAEETVDEAGKTGAQRMIEDGALEGVAGAISLHVDGSIPAGKIGVESGYVSGAEDSFHALIRGRGGHGAHPDETIDPVWIGSQVLAALYALPSRKVDPLSPCVLSIGRVQAGEAHNVIPAVFLIEGTIRAVDEKTRSILESELERCLGIARLMGGDFELGILRGCPPMRNDERVAALVGGLVDEMLGPDARSELRRSLGAEDFAFVTELVPGMQFRLGAMPKDGRPRLLHSPDFDLDEDALPLGAALLYAAALRMAESLYHDAPRPPTSTS